MRSSWPGWHLQISALRPFQVGPGTTPLHDLDKLPILVFEAIGAYPFQIQDRRLVLLLSPGKLVDDAIEGFQHRQTLSRLLFSLRGQ